MWALYHKRSEIALIMLQRSIYAITAVAATGLLVACGDSAIFDRVAAERSDAVASADWPRLVDVPAAPPQGVYTDAAPDPARGDAAQIDLAVAAETAERRREAVSGPVE